MAAPCSEGTRGPKDLYQNWLSNLAPSANMGDEVRMQEVANRLLRSQSVRNRESLGALNVRKNLRRSDLGMFGALLSCALPQAQVHNLQRKSELLCQHQIGKKQLFM
jgi:hypothetical protein